MTISKGMNQDELKEWSVKEQLEQLAQDMADVLTDRLHADHEGMPSIGFEDADPELDEFRDRVLEIAAPL